MPFKLKCLDLARKAVCTSLFHSRSRAQVWSHLPSKRNVHKRHLVVRGLKDRSMRRTLEEVQQIIGERKVSWVIDPTAFDRFDVTSVPTIVLTSPRISASSCSTNECTPSDAFAKVAGEVPIEHALREIERRVQPLASVAAPYIRRLSSSWR